MALKKQPRGMKNILVVIDNQKPGGCGSGRERHVFDNEQVSAIMYGNGQGVTRDYRKLLK
jgi:hypothetical protein